MVMFMKKCRKIVVLGALILLLCGCFLQNHRSDCVEQQCASNADVFSERDVFPG